MVAGGELDRTGSRWMPNGSKDIEIVERVGLEPHTSANEFDPERMKARDRGDEEESETAAGTATSNAGD